MKPRRTVKSVYMVAFSGDGLYVGYCAHKEPFPAVFELKSDAEEAMPRIEAWVTNDSTMGVMKCIDKDTLKLEIIEVVMKCSM